MKAIHWVIIGSLIFMLLLGTGLAGCPVYNVWQQGLAGEARLKRAVQEKQIAIEQAKAEVESSKLRAEAIQTIGAMAKKYPEYRLQEFIGAFADAMGNGKIQKIIYVPTEANIPIIEATRLNE